MATYTMELRQIVEEMGIDIGLDDYPIYDETHRDELNQKIKDHFWYREIGFETVDQFINRLNYRMRLIMPVYNDLYKSTKLEFDALTTTKLTTDSEGEGTEKATGTNNSTSEATNTSESEAKSRSVSNDFPMSQLVPDQDYATGAADSISNSNVTGNATQADEQQTVQEADTTRKSHTTMEGYTTNPSDLLLRYRATIINVDAAIIADLEQLFMGIWSNGDEMFDYPTLYPYYYGMSGVFR